MSWKHIPRRVVLACAAVPAGIGLFVLAGWAVGQGALMGGRPSYIPMAPNTALLFTFLGGAMAATEIRPAHWWVRRGWIAISLYTVIVAGGTLAGFLTGHDLGIDHWLFHSSERPDTMRIGHMSPLTALSFLLIGCAFLARERRSRSAEAILGSGVALVGWVNVTGYAYGAPLLYGGTVIPVALPTAVCLTLLGVALIGAAGPGTWPWRCLSGPSTRARLMRGFLPAIFLLLLIKDWMVAFTLQPTGPSLVLASALSNIMALLMFGVLISRLSRVLGREIDQTTAALRASEERFRKAVVESPFPIMLHSENGAVHQVSQSWCEITGYSPEELRTMEDWATRAYGERSRSIRAEIDSLYDLGHRVAEGDYPIRTKSGGTRIWEFSSAPLGRSPDGQRLVMSMAMDVTERRKAEESLRETRDYLQNLLDYANAPIIVWDPQFRITRFNHAFEALTGRSAGDVVGQSLEMLIPAVQLESSMAHIRNALAGERWETVEISILHLDGSVRIVLWNSATLYTPDGQTPVATIAQGQDITERKRAEARKAELEAQNRQLQKAESLGRMAGAIAHHFNNQLQAVMMSLEMAMNSSSQPEEALGVLTQAMQSARKAAAMSGLMLTYLGLTPGKRQPVDLAEVCRSSLSLLRAAAPQNLVLETDLPAPGPVIDADPEQIAQVLTQLVTNACEASGDGRGGIRLGVKMVSAEDISAAHRFPVGWQPQAPVYACLEVADTGSGIAKQDIESIFDPFFSHKFTGRGMGLAVVLGIVRACDGAVTVASEPGRGSVFRLFFPVSEKVVPRPSIPAA